MAASPAPTRTGPRRTPSADSCRRLRVRSHCSTSGPTDSSRTWPAAGQAHAVPGALEEARAELALELLHGHRDRRLGAEESPGGGAEAAFPGDGEKDAGLLDLHVTPINVILYQRISPIDLTGHRRSGTLLFVGHDRRQYGSEDVRVADRRLDSPGTRGLPSRRLHRRGPGARGRAAPARGRDAGALGAPRERLLRDPGLRARDRRARAGRVGGRPRRRPPTRAWRPARPSSAASTTRCAIAKRRWTSARKIRRSGGISALARRRAGMLREAVTGLREALRLDPRDAAGAGHRARPGPPGARRVGSARPRRTVKRSSGRRTAPSSGATWRPSTPRWGSSPNPITPSARRFA